MHSHHDGTSMCHASTRKMHQTLYFWSKLNVYLKQMYFIFSPSCIFQGRLLTIPVKYTMQDTDYTQRFLFENTHVRGERVHLSESLEAVFSVQDYPETVSTLLGELIAASLLLSSTLKFSGTFSLQIRSQGAISLLLVEATDQRSFRAVARWQDNEITPDQSLATLMPEGSLLVTATPDRGKRYQGIIALDHPSLADCITAYFRQSEQLPTKLWLSCSGSRASGLLLQLLPVNKAEESLQEKEMDQWEHVTILANTVTCEELLTLDNQTLLKRLFHQDIIQLFQAEAVHYRCTCSKKRTSEALISLGEQELNSILEEQGSLDIKCHFCNTSYHFTEKDITELLV